MGDQRRQSEAVQFQPGQRGVDMSGVEEGVGAVLWDAGPERVIVDWDLNGTNELHLKWNLAPGA